MISRYEYLYIKSRIKKIEDILFEYEMNSEIYKEWDKFIHLNKQEQEEVMENWNKYFQKCQESFWGRAFFSLYSVFKKMLNVFNKSKAIISWERKNPQKTIEKPKEPIGIDPLELKHLIGNYYQLKNTLNQLKKIQEEYSPIYEKQVDVGL